ncbi:MAG: pyridoxamine 5'-phosphate oxidase family protein [Solirubrobacteraceae bacterium]|nr:pyridoxamine 5'-phosphate oxidase family protein [Solirubrobacteraceae bacterium]
MPSRRELIQLTEDEALAFLDEERVMICATNGRDGFPHLMPLWFVVRDGRIWAWTFAKSQKVKNLERDARASIQVEAGDGEYAQLRGIMLKCDVVVHRETADVQALGEEIFTRYAPPGIGELAPEVKAMVAKQAEKRVGLEFVERERATWDHRKLGGTY